MWVLHFVFDHGSTILLCVVLMWLVLKWKDAEACTKIVQMSLDLSDRWRKLAEMDAERQHELTKGLIEKTDRLHSETTKLHEQLSKRQDEISSLYDCNFRIVNENLDFRMQITALEERLDDQKGVRRVYKQ
jgi:hypothetical protein